MRQLQGASLQSRSRRDRWRHRDQMPALSRLQYAEACEPFPDRRPSGRNEELTLWIYLPPTGLKPETSVASLSAPATPGSTSACTSPSPPTGLFVSSSGKATLRRLSWRGWKTRPWHQRLSGMTFGRSTADLGAAAFISSLPAIHASPSASPERGRRRRIRVTYSPDVARDRRRGPARMGLLRKRRGAPLSGIRRRRREAYVELGYTTKAGLFSAREAGASHRRRRLFLLAHADRERCRLFSGLIVTDDGSRMV